MLNDNIASYLLSNYLIDIFATINNVVIIYY